MIPWFSPMRGMMFLLFMDLGKIVYKIVLLVSTVILDNLPNFLLFLKITPGFLLISQNHEFSVELGGFFEVEIKLSHLQEYDFVVVSSYIET